MLATLDPLKLTRNTIVPLTSDNGPVVDDGYRDDAVEKLGDHLPAGPFRWGKYSNFEAGTRVPFLVRWPARVKPSVSAALVSQVDLIASLAALLGSPASDPSARDSENVLPALIGAATVGRTLLVEQAGGLSLRQGSWKYIMPGKGARVQQNTNTELGNDPEPQLALFGGVACVLLIACGNVACLTLSRSLARTREHAVRAALGASRLRIAREILIEAWVLALLGAGFGVPLAIAGVSGLVSLAPPHLPRLHAIGVDGSMLVFGVLLTFVTSILCGLLPAWHGARTNLEAALREGGRGDSQGGRSLVWHRLLVVVQVALCFVLPAIQQVMSSIDPELPVFDVTTLEDIAASAVATQRFALLLFGLFATLALGLSVLGIYGVLAYAVAQRLPELGVRLALGASPQQLRQLVLAQGARLVGIGLVVGAATSVVATGWLRGLLFGVTPFDPLTLAAVSILFGSVALVACLLPARRAARVDPIATLRSQ